MLTAIIPNLPSVEDCTVASDAAQDEHNEVAAHVLGCTEDDLYSTAEDVEEWLDDLTLADVLGSEHADVDWNGEEESTHDGRAIVIRDSRRFEEKVAQILVAMVEHEFGDDFERFWEQDNTIDTLVWSRHGTWANGTKLEVHSGEDTDICCACFDTLIHVDPYSGRAPSVFVDGEGFMCEDCCQSDPEDAMERAAAEPSLCTLRPSDTFDPEELRELGWHRVVVCDNEVASIEKKHKRTIVTFIGRRALPTDEDAGFWSRYARAAHYRAHEIWFKRGR